MIKKWIDKLKKKDKKKSKGQDDNEGTTQGDKFRGVGRNSVPLNFNSHLNGTP